MSAMLQFGCDQERPPISRVQANALSKAIFVGEDISDSADDPEFYYWATLVDVGYGATQSGLFTSTYAQPVARIKWDIQENYLLARLSHELIDNTDGKGLGNPTQDGVVVAAFAIKSHFDIQQEYNPTTGEQLNIVAENSTDRHWHERAYFRVDWSMNHNTSNYDFDLLSALGVFGGVKYSALALEETQSEGPNAPVFAEKYFDVTTKAFAEPQTVDLSHLNIGLSQLPACLLSPDFGGGTAPEDSCAPDEITIRHAFRQVEPSDYTPINWDGQRFQAFGAFVTERYGFDELYGLSDDQWRRFASRYNIWKRSHYYAETDRMSGGISCNTSKTTGYGQDPNRDLDGDGTADECGAAPAGSQCDVERHLCTLPLHMREVNPVVWYYSTGSDPVFFEATRRATDQWDAAMRAAVQAAKYVECRRLGQAEWACAGEYPVYWGQQAEHDDLLALVHEVNHCRYGSGDQSNAACNELAETIGERRGYSGAVIDLAKMPAMVLICHSPVEASDPKACGDEGTEVRLGDLRYHQINVIESPQVASPWGIYSDAHDPLTGETLAASINVWSNINRQWSRQVVEQARWVGGELATSDITEANHVQPWIGRASGRTGGLLPLLSKDEVNARLAGASPISDDQFKVANQVSLAGQSQLNDRLFRPMYEVSQTRADAYAQSMLQPVYHQRQQRAKGSPLEAALTTPWMSPLLASGGAEASPLNLGGLSAQHRFETARGLALARQGACIYKEAPIPTGVRSLAKHLQQKFGPFDPEASEGAQAERAERMRQYVSERAHFGVVLHEMGHSFGLRHNFVSSSDAFNYRPQYWALRSRNGQVSQACDGPSASGEGCVGPRYYDPVTEEEEDNLIWMFMQSSVMDYAGEYTQNMLGLGAYDFAALKMIYGDVVSVYRDPSYLTGTSRAKAALSKLDNFGGILGFQWNNGEAPIHYPLLNRDFTLIHDCSSVDQAHFRPRYWNEDIHGVWSPVLDGQLVRVDGVYTRCKDQPVDYAAWQDLKPPSERDLYQGIGGDVRGVLNDRQVRVPYGFASDRWADLGNLAVYRADNGADTYELFNFLITRQEMSHIFDNYRRRRQAFSVRRAVGRSLRAYSAKLRDGSKGIGLLANIYRDFSESESLRFSEVWPLVVDEPSIQTNIIASSLAFDHFTRQLQRPESGDHYIDPSTGILRSTKDSEGRAGETVMTIPNGVGGQGQVLGIGGRPVANRFAEERGEYNSEYTTNIGSYYEKILSAMLMTESVDNFISSSRRDFTDARYRAVSMADVFPEGYRRWLATHLTNDEVLKSVFVRVEEDVPVVDVNRFPRSPLGWTSWWRPDPQLCFHEPDLTSCLLEGVGGFAPVDSQVGWEQQKFLIAWTLIYLPENQQRWWLDQLGIWVLGADGDPGFLNRLEFHNPTGDVMVARTSGKESIYGQTVQRGVAARMLEYANRLLAQAYEVTDGPDLDQDSQPDWYYPVYIEGRPIVKYDPSILSLSPTRRPGCNETENVLCSCEDNRACLELEKYVAVPTFMREAMRDLGMRHPTMRGLF